MLRLWSLLCVLLLADAVSSAIIGRSTSNTVRIYKPRVKRQFDLVFSDPYGGPMQLTGFGFDGMIFDPSMMMPGSYTPLADIYQLNL